MPVEIERKFTIANDSWRSMVNASRRVKQGYFASQGPTMRLRVQSNEAFLTIKGPTTGLSRDEYEYAIPVQDAEEMLQAFCIQPYIDKTRHLVAHDGLTFEVDEFHGANAGLIVAEVELQSENQTFSRPDWLGEDVSMDTRYRNLALVFHPFSHWEKQAR